MYGNSEYGSTPYGDIQATITIIIITLAKKDIEILFNSAKKPFLFISERKQTIFRAESTGVVNAKNI